MTPATFPRKHLQETLLGRAREGAPLLLTGPPGAGKTTLLRAAAQALASEGWHPVYLDLMGAASSPERFVTAALSALPTEAADAERREVEKARRLAASGRAHGAAAVEALFALWSRLDGVRGRPLALLLDEATEIRSLAYFGGLRQVDKLLGTCLSSRPRGTLLATSFPTLARRLWPDLETIAAGPLEAAELEASLRQAGIEADARALWRASFGWPRHARVLADRLAVGDELAAAWAEEMAPAGRLELACRHTYETLLLRSRGYGISKAVLAAVAEEEGLNLTALVARLGRTAGATRDYLVWLVGVDALRAVKKRYYYVDGMVRWWVRLHARGTPPRPEELPTAAREIIEGGPAASAPEAAPEPQVVQPFARRESLMEID